MRTIDIAVKKQKDITFKTGDFFVVHKDSSFAGELHIVSEDVNLNFIMVSLKDGEPWTEPKSYREFQGMIKNNFEKIPVGSKITLKV